MTELYTKEFLQGQSRVTLRQIAMKELGLSAREISEMKSDAIIAAILDKQKQAPPPPPEPKGPPPEEVKAALKAVPTKKDTPVPSAIDAVGKAVDELGERIDALERQLFVVFGLVTDIWMGTVGDGREGLEERVKELEDDYKGNS